jgi:predicted dehydrogenase
MGKLRAGVIGVGYLGSFHAEKYARLQGVELTGVADIKSARGSEIAARYGVPAYTDYRELLGGIELASIVVPTESHYQVARGCLEAGVHILVEKPVTQTVEQADHLIGLALERNCVFQVGHLERFNPALLALQGTLKHPVFIESHRLAPFKARGTDISVVLDLMIHDIDIILNMVASPLKEVRAMGVPVLTDEIDIGNARLEFQSGCVANVTASRVSPHAMRKIRVFQPDEYISIDYLERSIALSRKQSAGITPMELPRIETQEMKFDQQDALALEISAFIDAISNGAPPPVSGADGKRALEVALEISRHMQARIA